ncbi:uncharacterized protein LOC144295132 [Canis aureus]
MSQREGGPPGAADTSGRRGANPVPAPRGEVARSAARRTGRAGPRRGPRGAPFGTGAGSGLLPGGGEPQVSWKTRERKTPCDSSLPSFRKEPVAGRHLTSRGRAERPAQGARGRDASSWGSALPPGRPCLRGCCLDLSVTRPLRLRGNTCLSLALDATASRRCPSARPPALASRGLGPLQACPLGRPLRRSGSRRCSATPGHSGLPLPRLPAAAGAGRVHRPPPSLGPRGSVRLLVAPGPSFVHWTLRLWPCPGLSGTILTVLSVPSFSPLPPLQMPPQVCFSSPTACILRSEQPQQWPPLATFPASLAPCASSPGRSF